MLSTKRKRVAPKNDFNYDGDWSDEEKPAKKAGKAAKKAAAAAAAAAQQQQQQQGGGAVDFKQLDTKSLQKYRALFKLPGDADVSKSDLVATVSAHFYRQQVDEDETLLRFVVALRRQSPMGLRLGPAAQRDGGGGGGGGKPERAPAQ